MKLKLEQYRRKRKLTQAQLATLSGVPQPMISMIESKTVPNPTIGTIYRLAVALKCTTDDLIEEDRQ